MELDISTQVELHSVPCGRLLGIDYGQRRIGLALSDPSQFLSSTYKTIENKKSKTALKEISDIAVSQNISAIVIGLPLHMNGSVGERAQQVIQFQVDLAKQIDVPYFFWDERWSTASAEKSMLETGKSPSRNRDKIDQVAAAFILQSFLDRINYMRRNQETQK